MNRWKRQETWMGTVRWQVSIPPGSCYCGTSRIKDGPIETDCDNCQQHNLKLTRS